MHLVRRSCAVLTAAVLTTAILVAAPSTAAPPDAADRGSTQVAKATRAQMVFTWQRIALRTVYTVGATPVPIGIPSLGFTSLAMHRAVQSSLRRDVSSERAALVEAAYRVLRRYYPAQSAQLAADRATSLASVNPGRAKKTGVKMGKRAARHLLAERVGDHYMDSTIHYTLPPGPGVWQAAPATDMLGAWVGSLRHLVVRKHVKVGGPDALTSSAYTEQFEEVKSLGSSTSTTRTEAERQTALFFNSNPPIMYGEALIGHLQRHPIGLAESARLFAAVHAAMTDSLIQCWRLKRDVGFWRPIQAIREAENDGNPATTDDDMWTPLVPNPLYSEYVSGHGCVTGPTMEVIRRIFGERTQLTLVSANSPIPRTYKRLRALERDAVNARIWSGLHFRTAMVDAYRIGHITARRVLKALD